MLNQDLNLNQNFFNEDVERQPTRKGYGTGLVELGESDNNIVVLSADLTESTQAHLFAEKFPDRMFQMGVAEQNMAAVAAGFGVSGKRAFISSYATFSPGKNWETIRTTIAYNNSDVKVAGHHAGTMTGPDGATHQATEDIAIVRVLPNFKVLVPCDHIQAHKATLQAGNEYGPYYIRYTRDKSPVITTDSTPFELGKGQVFWKGNSPRIAIFSTGFLTSEAIFAANELKNEGVEVDVINIHSIKPLDLDLILSYSHTVGGFVTVEDHQIAGGLGSAIAEFVAQNKPIPIEFVGMKDSFGETGTPAELLKKYKMDKDGIKESVNKLLSKI